MRSRSVAAFLAVFAASLLTMVVPSNTLGDPASDLAAAESEQASANSTLVAAELALVQAEKSADPIVLKAKRADEAVEAAEGEVRAVETKLIADRRRAQNQVEDAEASYNDEKSSHDTITGIGIALAIAAILVAIAGFVLSRSGKWSIPKKLALPLGGLLGVIFVGGLVLAFVPSDPNAPQFSNEIRELAKAAEGNPLNPPTHKLQESKAAVVPLVEKAEPLDSARDKAEGQVESAESKVQHAEGVLASAKSDVNAVQKKVAQIEAVAAEESEFREDATTIDYGQLIKNPSAYKGEKVVYTGQVLQIQEEGGFGFMLLSVTDEGYGFWTNNIWVEFEQRTGIAEEDIITVYGTIIGSEEYETQAGGSTYVPKMRAKYIEE